MNEDLKHELDIYYETIKEGRPNYRSCYNSFLEYCSKFSEYSLRKLLEETITISDIEMACIQYFKNSRKATSLEAIQRFLTAIDQFFKYLKNKKIVNSHMEDGCRRKEVIHRICIGLNEELEQKIYLPFDGKNELKIVEEQIKLLNKNNFYQFGQSVIYRLLTNYGFKEKIIINLKLDDFDRKKGTLLINFEEEGSISIHLREDIFLDLDRYCTLHKYQSRVHLFTKSNGISLTPDSILGTLKGRMKRFDIPNFTPTSVALQGVAALIEKGLTIGEIKILTGFETQKIEDVSKYLLTDVDVEETINAKLSILKNLGVPQQTILANIQEQYNLSPEDSKKYL